MDQFLQSTNLLETIVSAAEENSKAARELFSGLSTAQLNWKPAPEKWSIAQCLDHLAITSHEFDGYFSDALVRGRKKWPGTIGPAYRPSFMGGWLIKQVNPEGGRNLTAPKVFRPSESSNIDEPLAKFLKQQGRFIEFVRETSGVDYNKTKLRSPVTPLIRYSLADAFVVTVVHGRRHLGQARRVRETSGFPIGS
ncbi:MAG TPA: DinB family protein [Pyrinomonadaceae bacterium]|nr:DinB family protein [Pyrinomonadaceae bacterium]